MAKPVVNLPGEIWKPVEGFGDFYAASNMGRIKTTRRPGSPGGLLKSKTKPSGYKYVALCAGGVVTYKHVHDLVLTAFWGQRPPEHDCCHRNGNKADNRLANLYWGTRKQNMRDAVRAGTISRGERRPNSKFTNAQIRDIRARYLPGDPTHGQSAMARSYGVAQGVIYCIIHRRTWKHVE